MSILLWDKINIIIANLVLFSIIIFYRRVRHKGRIEDFSIHFNKKGGQLFKKGLLLGILTFILFPLVIIFTNTGSFSFSLNGIKNTLLNLLFGIIAYFSVSLFEEALFRGFILDRFLNSFSIKASIIATSVIYGLFYYYAYSSNTFKWLGLFNGFLIGIFFAIITIETESIMFNLGFHLIWNLSKSIIFMESIYNIPSLINLQIKEGLLGGNIGTPESGLGISIILGIILIYTYYRYKKTGRVLS